MTCGAAEVQALDGYQESLSMKNLQIGLIVVGAMTAVFALGASILGALERALALRGTAAVPGSPSRAIAIPELIGAVALIAFGIVSPPTSRQAGASVMMVGGGTGILVHAGSAFMRGDRVRQRVGRVGLGLLALSACIAVYYLGRH